MTQVQRVYSKQCRYCSSKDKPVQIFWNDIKKYFSDGPHSDSPKHACPSSSTKDRQLEQDKRLNQTINDLRLELDAKFDGLKEDMSSQNQATQKAVAGLRGEIANLYSLWKSHKCWTE
jgi:hypothetical protein